jgi:hypothetical protein
MRDFLNGIPPYTYNYADPANGTGTRMGPMAQDLEQAGPIGQGMVQTGPDGLKRVDTGQAALASLAALSHLNQRLNQLEKISPELQGMKRAESMLNQKHAAEKQLRVAASDAREITGAPDMSEWEKYRG